MRRLTLRTLGGRLGIARLGPHDAVPVWAFRSDTTALASVTRAPDELSIVCAEEAIPDGVTSERGFRALKLQGPFAFGETGVLESVARPLADAAVPIFAISTFDTDYVLVKEDRLGDAVAALSAAGHEVG